MGFVEPEFGPAMAEIALATGICIVLLADLFLSSRFRGVTLLLSLVTLTVVAWFSASVEGTALTFSGSYIADPLAKLLKLFTLPLLILPVIFSLFF